MASSTATAAQSTDLTVKFASFWSPLYSVSPFVLYLEEIHQLAMGKRSEDASSMCGQIIGNMPIQSEAAGTFTGLSLHLGQQNLTSSFDIRLMPRSVTIVFDSHHASRRQLQAFACALSTP
jgi:hypothetical protein